MITFELHIRIGMFIVTIKYGGFLLSTKQNNQGKYIQEEHIYHPNNI